MSGPPPGTRPARRARVARRLFASFLILLTAATVPALLLVRSWVGNEARGHVRDSLEREARVLAADLLRDAPPSPTDWMHALRSETRARLTLIAPDGRVVADSEISDDRLGSVESHARRPEILTALDGSLGYDVRHSATLDRDLTYVAVPVGAPPRLVLRLALDNDQVDRVVARAQSAVSVAAVIAALLALLLGGIAARHLTRPLEEMTRAAAQMAAGRLDEPLPPPHRRDELGELGVALEGLRRELAARIAELKRERDNLGAVLHGLAEGVALLEADTVAVANPAFVHLLGATDEVLGRRLIEVSRLPELHEALGEAQKSARPGTAVVREPRIGERSLRVRVSALMTAEPSRFLVVIEDMTEAQRLERMRRDFVANASHELRTPVAAIVGAAETLAQGAADDAATRQSFVDILLRHAHRLSRLTADLLDLARLEAGYRPRSEIVALAPVFEALAQGFGPRAREKGLALELPPKLTLSVRAERASLEQILTNLVDNAIKYTPAGGSVRVDARGGSGVVTLEVKDTGPGISPEHLPRLFERFYRVDAARSRELGGTGLGLAIVKHLATAHGGEVSVDSAPGRGTVFRVTLASG